MGPPEDLIDNVPNMGSEMKIPINEVIELFEKATKVFETSIGGGVIGAGIKAGGKKKQKCLQLFDTVYFDAIRRAYDMLENPSRLRPSTFRSDSPHQTVIIVASYMDPSLEDLRIFCGCEATEESDKLLKMYRDMKEEEETRMRREQARANRSRKGMTTSTTTSTTATDGSGEDDG